MAGKNFRGAVTANSWNNKIKNGKNSVTGLAV